jgi:hypothetical protein
MSVGPHRPVTSASLQREAGYITTPHVTLTWLNVTVSRCDLKKTRMALSVCGLGLPVRVKLSGHMSS